MRVRNDHRLHFEPARCLSTRNYLRDRRTPTHMMSPGVVVHDVVAEPRSSNSGERLALKMDQRDRERKAGDLQALLPNLEAEVGVLEVSNEIFLVEPSDRFVNLASHQRAGPSYGLAHDKLFRLGAALGSPAPGCLLM